MLFGKLSKVSAEFKKGYLKKIFISYILLIFLPVLIVGIILYDYSRNIIDEEVSKSISDLLDQTSSIYSEIILDARNLFFQMTSNKIAIELIQKPEPFFSTYDGKKRLKDIIDVYETLAASNKYVDSLWIYIDVCKMVATSNKGAIPYDQIGYKSWFMDPLPDGRLMEWVAAKDRNILNAESDELYYGFRGRFLNLPNITNDMVFVKLNIKAINEKVSQLKIRQTGYVLVTDGTGRILFNKDESLLMKDLSSVCRDDVILKGNKGYYIDKINGKKMMVVYTTIESLGWKEVALIPLNEITNKMDIIRRIAIFVVFSTLIVVLLFSILVSRKIYSPIGILVRSMKRVEAGDLNVYIEDKRNDEFSFLYRIFNNMLRRINELLINTLKLELMNKDAELKALQAQINPHFLNNTLNSMFCMAKSFGAEELSKMTYRLSEYFRLSFEDSKEEIEILEELNHIKCYIDIQSIRFCDKLIVVYNIDEVIYRHKILRFLLQPLVENSINHGMRGNRMALNLKVNGMISNDKIRFEVIDDGAGIDDEKLLRIKKSLDDKEEETEYFALRNINSRMKLYYGEAYGLDIQSNLGEGTRVTVEIPVK